MRYKSFEMEAGTRTPAGYRYTLSAVGNRTGRIATADNAGMLLAQQELADELYWKAQANALFPSLTTTISPLFEEDPTPELEVVEEDNQVPHSNGYEVSQPEYTTTWATPAPIEVMPLFEREVIPEAEVETEDPNVAGTVVLELQTLMAEAFEANDRHGFFRHIDRIQELYDGYTEVQRDQIAELAAHYHSLFRERAFAEERMAVAVIPETPITLEVTEEEAEADDTSEVVKAVTQDIFELIGITPMTTAEFEEVLAEIYPAETHIEQIQEPPVVSVTMTNEEPVEQPDFLESIGYQPMTDARAEELIAELAHPIVIENNAQEEVVVQEQEPAPETETIVAQAEEIYEMPTPAVIQETDESIPTNPIGLPHFSPLGVPTSIVVPEPLPDHIVIRTGNIDEDDGFKLSAGDNPYEYQPYVSNIDYEEAQASCDAINAEIGIAIMQPDTDLFLLAQIGREFSNFLVDNGVYRVTETQSRYNVDPTYLAGRAYQEAVAYVNTYTTSTNRLSIGSLTTILTNIFNDYGFTAPDDRFTYTLIEQVARNNSSEFFAVSGFFAEETETEPQAIVDSPNFGEIIANQLVGFGFMYLPNDKRAPLPEDIVAGSVLVNIRNIVDREYAGVFHKLPAERIMQIMLESGYHNLNGHSPIEVRNIIRKLLANTHEGLSDLYPMENDLDLEDSPLRRILQSKRQSEANAEKIVTRPILQPQYAHEQIYTELAPTARTYELQEAFDVAYQEDDRVLFNITVENLLAEMDSYNYWELYHARQLLEHALFMFENGYYEWKPETFGERIADLGLRFLKLFPAFNEIIEEEDENELDLHLIQNAINQITEQAMALHKMAENPKLRSMVHVNAPISGFLRKGFKPYGEVTGGGSVAPTVVVPVGVLLLSAFQRQNTPTN